MTATEVEGAPRDQLIGWVTLAETDALWADAAYLEDSAVRGVLEAAQGACIEYLTPAHGELIVPDPVPEGWRLAQVMQARHLWARMRTGDRDTLGPDGFAISTYPLVLEARTLLRPKRSPWAGLL